MSHPNCCGITVISFLGGFEESSSEEETELDPFPPNDKDVNRILSLKDKRDPCHVYEVVLIDAQVVSWGEILKDVGFRKVCRFLNSNSYNYCTIFHLYDGKIGEEYQVFDPTHDVETLLPMKEAV